MSKEPVKTPTNEPKFKLNELREAAVEAFKVEPHVFDGAAKLARFTKTDEIPKSLMVDAIFKYLNRPVPKRKHSK